MLTLFSESQVHNQTVGCGVDDGEGEERNMSPPSERKSLVFRDWAWRSRRQGLAGRAAGVPGCRGPAAGSVWGMVVGCRYHHHTGPLRGGVLVPSLFHV